MARPKKCYRPLVLWMKKFDGLRFYWMTAAHFQRGSRYMVTRVEGFVKCINSSVVDGMVTKYETVRDMVWHHDGAAYFHGKRSPEFDIKF